MIPQERWEVGEGRWENFIQLVITPNQKKKKTDISRAGL